VCAFGSLQPLRRFLFSVVDVFFIFINLFMKTPRFACDGGVRVSFIHTTCTKRWTMDTGSAGR
jgi:hypothetical protein